MICNCCGSNKFRFSEVLWEKLIEDWNLTDYEANYINRQQGYCCKECGSSLRVIALATAIMRNFNYDKKFKDFIKERSVRKLKILEINSAGCLSQFLGNLKNHTQTSYPEIDIMEMPYENEYFDMIIHSDVLEHVENPVKGLSECHRVLKQGGRCVFTVPIIVNRLTKSRANKTPSYHGSPDNNNLDMLVFTEYGSDVWKHVIQAGFCECRIYSYEFPSANAITGIK